MLPTGPEGEPPGRYDRTVTRAPSNGWLALVGGGEWEDGIDDLYRRLLDASGAKRVVVLATAAAFEHADRVVEHAATRFDKLGAPVEGVMAFRHADADDEKFVKHLAGAKFIVIADGSPLHLRSVLKGSALWQAVVDAHAAGAVLCGSGAGAMVIGDPMVDPRGGAYTVGLGLVSGLAVFPHHDTAADHLKQRSIELRPKVATLAAVDERTALVRQPDRTWSVAGTGTVTLYAAGTERDAAPEVCQPDSVIRTLVM